MNPFSPLIICSPCLSPFLNIEKIEKIYRFGMAEKNFKEKLISAGAFISAPSGTLSHTSLQKVRG